ncbi:uncharacterized protein LOC129277928 [Lytechinus pictus]|uniref:uncharacterized protein LOC129277928 n=1 Tax=Lytechinus pictus TaxID=7653 RepID=UPI0030B9AE01
MADEAQPERAEPLLSVGEDVNQRLTSQAAEIKRLTETLSRYMDRESSAPIHYDPDVDLEPKELDIREDADLYDTGISVGPAKFDKLAERLTKAVTLPPKKESLEKISSRYLTPSNAPEACTPRIVPEVWQTISGRARSNDVRLQKLQNNVLQGLLPYGEILEELHAATSQKRPVNIERIKEFSLDGLTLSGHASYELSMYRRAEIKPYINPKYKGLCSRNTPLDEKLFGKDIQSTLKNVAEAYNVGQKSHIMGRPHVATPRGSKPIFPLSVAMTSRDNDRLSGTALELQQRCLVHRFHPHAFQRTRIVRALRFIDRQKSKF